MVGQRTTAAAKPSRSDEILEPERQEEIANQVRAQFDSLAPKRPAKPNRSEPDQVCVTGDDKPEIPELERFRSLQKIQFHVNLTGEKDFPAEGHEEFVETEYYKELGSIDKQHHTTGSGFIRIAKEGDEQIINGYDKVGIVNGGIEAKHVYRSNPATNDWVPNTEDHQVYVSSKPNRSETS